MSILYQLSTITRFNTANSQLNFLLILVYLSNRLHKSISPSSYIFSQVYPYLQLLWVIPLHIEWSFPLKIASVNVTKTAVSPDSATFTEETLNGELQFVCSVPRNYVTYWLEFKSSLCCLILIVYRQYHKLKQGTISLAFSMYPMIPMHTAHRVPTPYFPAQSLCPFYRVYETEATYHLCFNHIYSKRISLKMNPPLLQFY